MPPEPSTPPLPLEEPHPLEASGSSHPPYVRTRAERRRWRLALEAASSCSAALQQGRVDAGFVLFATRSLYFSEIETGEASPERA